MPWTDTEAHGDAIIKSSACYDTNSLHYTWLNTLAWVASRRHADVLDDHQAHDFYILPILEKHTGLSYDIDKWYLAR